MADAYNTPDSDSPIPSEHESLIARFEQLWSEGQTPRIEDFLPSDDARVAVIAELVAAELEFRFKLKQDPQLEEYLVRFPELVEHKNLAIQLAKEEFRRRKQRFEQVIPSEFSLRFPALAPELEKELESTVSSVQSDLNNKSEPLQSTPESADVTTNLSGMEWLAKGGMGEVYVAVDGTLNRRVAMKVIQTKYGRNAEALRRFVSEAEITSRLEHPGIAPVYGFGAMSDGRPCYAMRYIRGESMGDAILSFFRRAEHPKIATQLALSDSVKSRSQLDSIEATKPRLDLHTGDRNLRFRMLLQRFVAVCNTLAYAHQQGVLHRDLKPENIRLGEHGETILLDWGLAKELELQRELEGSRKYVGQLEHDTSDAQKTKIGSIYGTPQFMSPEQARRDGALLTPAADIYGLGATLYYLLTGHTPFVKDSPSKIVERVERGEFPRPRAICRDIPASLEAICLKAMALEPDKRYRTAIEMADDVERFLADEATSVYAGSVATRIRRWIVHHRTLASIALTGCLAGIAWLTMWTIVSSQHAQVLEQKNRSLVEANAAEVAAANDARQQRDAVNLRSQQVLGLTKSIVELVSVTGPEGFSINSKGEWSARSMNQFSTSEYLDRVIAELNNKFAQNDPVRGTILAAVGQTKRGSGLFEEAAPLLEEAYQLRKKQSDPNDQEAANIEFDLAWCLIEMQGREAEATQHFREVVASRKQFVPRDDAALGMAQAGLMFGLYVQGQPQWQILLEMAPEAAFFGRDGSINVVQVYAKFRSAEDARVQRNWILADELYAEVANAIAKIVPEGHPARALSDFMMAGYMRARGDLRQAEVFVLRAMKIYREKIGTHTYMCDPLFQIARVREQYGDFEEAEALHREAFWLANLNPHSRRNFRWLTTQGFVSFLAMVGKYDEAIAIIDAALNGPNRIEGGDALELQTRRIWAWMESGKYSAVVTDLPLEQSPNQFLSNPQSYRARALIELGRWDDAKAIMPIESHIGWDEILPRPMPNVITKLQRLQRYDGRTIQEIQAQLATDPIARDHMNSVGALRTLAIKKAELGDFAGARQDLREAAEITERRLSSRDSMPIVLTVDRAVVQMLESKTEDTLDELRRTAAEAQVRFGTESLSLANFLYDAGLIALYAGDRSLACTFFDVVIKNRSTRWTGVNGRIWSPVLHRIEATPDPQERQDFLKGQIRKMGMQGVSSWRIAVLTRELGATYRELGNHVEAEKLLLEAWTIFEPMLGPEHEVSRATAQELATVYETMNRPTEVDLWRKRSQAK